MGDKRSALLTRGGLARAQRSGWAPQRFTTILRKITDITKGRAQLVVPLGLALLLGRVTVVGVMKPFGTAFVIALAATGLYGRALAATVGAVVGGVLSPALGEGVEPWLVLLVVWFVAVGAGRWFRLQPPVVALGALLGTASLRLVVALFVGGDFALAGATTAAELAALVMFVPFARLWAVRPVVLSRGQLAAVLLVLGLALLGTEDVYVYGYSVAEVFMRAALLAVALIGGLGAGAAAGAAVSILSIVSAGGVTWSTLLLPSAGFLTGLGSHFGKIGAVVGLFTAHLLLSPYADDGVQIARGLAHSFIAAIMIVATPRSSMKSLAAALPGTPEARKATRERRRSAETAAQQQLRRIAAALDEVGRSLSQPRHASADVDDKAFDRFVADVSQRVCAGCAHHSFCWETHVYRTYRDLLSVAATGAAGDVRSTDLPSGLRQRCVKPDYLTKGINQSLTALYRAAPSLSSVYAEYGAAVGTADVYKLAPAQFAGIAAVIDGAADEIERRFVERHAQDIAFLDERPARYRLVTDVVQAAATGASMSGDYFRRVELPGQRMALILSDGMGTGPRAAAESEAAAAMLERFLLEGFGLKFALQMINAVLMLRADDDTYATLDVCLFDLVDGTVQMWKTGAAPTYVRRGKHVDVVQADSLPVGILHGVEATTVEYSLAPGDLVVMVTDGALEAATLTDDKAAAVARALRRLEKPDPHEAVDELFKRVRPSPGHELTDDVTIVAARIVPR